MASKQQNRRKALITYGVFAIVLVALILYITLRRSDRMQYGLPDLAQVEASSITRILIDGSGSPSIDLSMDGDMWYIMPEGFKADSSAVAGMVTSVAEFRLTDLVSTSKSYERYELDEEKLLKIVAADGDETLFEFYLGKRAPSYNHTYVRLPGDDNVYHAATDMRRVFDKQVDTLRDKNVLAFSKSEVIRIGVTLPENEFQLFKSTSQVSTESQSASTPVWRTSDEDEWAAEKVDEFLDRIDDLKCSSFIDDAQIDLGEPMLVLQIHTQDQHMLSIFEKEDGGYPAKSSQSPYAFYLSEWQGDSILETFAPGDPDD